MSGLALHDRAAMILGATGAAGPDLVAGAEVAEGRGAGDRRGAAERMGAAGRAGLAGYAGRGRSRGLQFGNAALERLEPRGQGLDRPPDGHLVEELHDV